MVIDSNEPGKVSVMLLGIFGKLSDSRVAFESRVSMKTQQSKGDRWD